MMMWLIALCMVAMFVIYAFHRIFNNNTNLKLPPGSMGLPFIGETLQFMIPSYSPDIHPFIKKRVERYGPIFRTRVLGQLVVVSTDEEFNKYLIKEEGKSVEIWLSPLGKLVMPREEGSKLVQTDLIKYFRNVALSHIGPDSIREKLLPQMEQFCSQTFHKWSTQTSVEVEGSAANMVFELFGKHYFGYDPEKLSENERLSENFASILSDGLTTIPLNIPGTTYHACKKDIKKIHKIMKNVLEERRKSQGKYGVDFFEQLNKVMAAEANLNEDQVIYMMIAIWLATFLAIQVVLALFFKFLADHPSILEELRVEHEDILKNRDGSNSNLTWQELKSMKFTHDVISEALRFSVSFPGLLRTVLKDIHINGYTIPAGCIVAIVTPMLHVNPKVYKDPLTFNPWRWKDLDSITVSNYFKPFGGGVRQCPGAEVSRAFMATFIHVLVTKYRWTKVKGGRLVRNPMLGFRDGVHIKIWEKPETNNDN